MLVVPHLLDMRMGLPLVDSDGDMSMTQERLILGGVFVGAMVGLLRGGKVRKVGLKVGLRVGVEREKERNVGRIVGRLEGLIVGPERSDVRAVGRTVVLGRTVVRTTGRGVGRILGRVVGRKVRREVGLDEINDCNRIIHAAHADRNEQVFLVDDPKQLAGIAGPSIPVVTVNLKAGIADNELVVPFVIG